MNIDDFDVTVGELFEGYEDRGEEGVVAYGGILDVRPPYQREFVYKDKQRDDVIRSVMKDFPLNVMYWVDRKDGNYEVLDGQQRTLSICQYLNGDFSIDGSYFHSQPDNVQRRIKEYKLTVYLCEGNDEEKLEWFEIVNIAGVELSRQELRNATYAGPWLAEAKRHFSRSGQVAAQISDGYVKVAVDRQELLQKAIIWVAGSADEAAIREYMSRHQKDSVVGEIWEHFKKVIAWVKKTFPKKRSHLMKDVDWGSLYIEHKNNMHDPDALEQQIAYLVALEGNTIRKKSGVYAYVLDGDERHLNLRTFDKNQKTAAYEKQDGMCAGCGKKFEFEEMEGDHIKPWKDGGLTVSENLQMLCVPCNQHKSDK